MRGSLRTVAFGPPATELLAAVVGERQAADPFAPVTVVVPSGATGATLRRRLAVRSGGLVGVAFRSLPQVASELGGAAGSDPAVPAAVSRAHLRAVLRSGTTLTPDPSVANSAATERALAATFAELRGVPDGALDAMAAREPLAAAVIDLFRRHRAAIGASPAADPAARAARLVAQGAVDPTALGSVVLHLPRRVRPGEVELLASLATRIDVTALVGLTGDPEADVVADELVALLAPVLGPAVAAGPPPATRPAPTRVIWAPDPAEEVDMAVRRVVAALSGLDGPPVRAERIAVVHRVRHPYAGLLHAALQAADVPHHVTAVTTLGQSVPGRLLTGLVEVASNGFRRSDVAALWRAGPLVDPVTGRAIRASWWDRLARQAGVGGGLDQWRQRIDQAVTKRRQHLEAWTPVSHSEPPETGDDDVAGPPTDRIVEGLLAVAAHVDWLAEALTPPAERTWRAWSGWLRGLLDGLLQPSAADRQPEALERVRAVLASLADLDGVELPPDLDRLGRVLEPELERPDRSHGRFGHGVLVGRLVDVVGADLDLVVVVGAADGRLPPRRVDDPLLPDRVRAAAGGHLAPRGLRREEEHRDLLAALAAAPERILVGHRSDPREQRERQPAAWLVAACSDLAGRLVGGADLGALAEEPWFDDVASFEAGPAGGATPASPRELDIGDLLADHRRHAAGSGVVASADPVLARGLAAATARHDGAFDEWSGHVGPSEVALAAFDRPRSPTGLERYAQCPFRFLLGDVLRVGGVDDPTEADLISAMDEGSLVHEILELFIGEHVGKPPEEPWSDEERARLLAIADSVAGEYEAEGRTGRALLWSVRWAQLRHQLLRVLDTDERLRATEAVSPVEVELQFGDEGADPVTVTMPSGRQIAFKGIIDRVDQSDDGERVVVYDYKTSRPESFRKVKAGIEHGDLTARGTKLQLPIYALAARTRFPDAKEIAAHYWFVGRQGEGQTIGAPVDERVEARFRDVLDVVVEGLESGCFPANPGAESYRYGQWTHENCSWCDFDRICPTSRGEAWVQVRTSGALARYVDLAEGPLDRGDDEPEEGP
jgi:ATP-dependent helicase/nuclease subunit B